MSLINPLVNVRAIGAFFAVIYKQRELTVEMTKREFSERYAGQMLGVLWGFAHPVVIILVYIFIFSYVFKAKADSNDIQTPLDYSVYLLAGLVPWMALSETLTKGTQVITSNANLVKQVIFPLEILPTKTVMASFVNEMILLAGVLLYAAFQLTGGPWWTFLLVPILLVLQFMQMLGVSMILATIGVYVRDLKDLVQVFCLVNVYLMPVVFTVERIPASLRWMMYMNPFSYQTLCFQDAIYYGSVSHFWVWGINGLLSVMLLGVGYRLFTRLRASMGNVL